MGIITATTAGETAQLTYDEDPANLPGWGTPTWRDEFDTDLTKWNVRTRATLGLLNDTAEVTASAVTVTDSAAHIKATWKTTPKAEGPQGILTHDTGYIEHRINGGGTMFAQRYGRWEIRAKVPTGPNTLGSLPAFWLRNSNSGEIDIMESWGYGATPKTNGQRDGTSTTTIHSHTATVPAGQTYTKHAWTLEDELRKKGFSPTKAYDGWHTWAFELTPQYCSTILDGNTAYRVTPATHPMIWDPRYFGTPLHMRINLHVGPSATYYGLPDPNNRQLTQNPLDYAIDYVRVWAYPAQQLTIALGGGQP